MAEGAFFLQVIHKMDPHCWHQKVLSPSRGPGGAFGFYVFLIKGTININAIPIIHPLHNKIFKDVNDAHIQEENKKEVKENKDIAAVMNHSQQSRL
jgi:hypothetical protein